MNTTKYPVFNGEYELLGSLGEGTTSKVYKARSLKDGKMVALKLLREDYLQKEEDAITAVENEIQILMNLKHHNVIGIHSYGSDGKIVKPSGRKIENLVYIVLELVSGGLMFDVCQTLGGMGEDGGRYFLSQMLDMLEYMHGKNVVHRDLKLENILVDEKMNLKVADFGFATFKKINQLKSYRGTMTYMAPEIKEGKAYDGRQADLFSTAVILFIVVQGIFPFKEAKKNEFFYNLIVQGDLQTYWKKTGGQNLSPEFKDLIIKMFSYDGSKRPTVKEIRNHPWMQTPCDMKQVRENILADLAEKETANTAASSREDVASRGDNMLDLIRQPASETLQLRKFNYMQDYDIDVTPGVIWDDLQAFNFEKCDGKLQLEKVGGKYIKLTSSEVVVKIKFFEIKQGDATSAGRTRIRFCKKQGDLEEWFDLFKSIREEQMCDILLAPVEAL